MSQTNMVRGAKNEMGMCVCVHVHFKDIYT
jgi:hypothetical protein